jgi:hypothetical protein
VTAASQRAAAMRVACMQPYFYPYIGYFQLLAACDVFVIADDVQYIQRGWVNRNRILVNGGAAWITLPVARAGHALPIHCREYLPDHRLAKRVRRSIAGAYRWAPHFAATMTLVDEVFDCREVNVAAFNTHLLARVAARLSIATPIRLASSMPCGRLAGQARVVDVCRRVGATTYLNPSGGVGLYDPATFSGEGIELRFLQSSVREYEQFGAPFVPSLSIIDVLMFNDVGTVRDMLREYRLVAKGRDGLSRDAGSPDADGS